MASFPPTADELAAAAEAGAAEVVSGFADALTAAGVTTLGYHEIADPEPPPAPVDRKSQLVAAGFTDNQADAIVAVLDAQSAPL